jgi:hypothetical protein
MNHKNLTHPPRETTMNLNSGRMTILCWQRNQIKGMKNKKERCRKTRAKESCAARDRRIKWPLRLIWRWLRWMPECNKASNLPPSCSVGNTSLKSSHQCLFPTTMCWCEKTTSTRKDCSRIKTTRVQPRICITITHSCMPKDRVGPHRKTKSINTIQLLKTKDLITPW